MLVWILITVFVVMVIKAALRRRADTAPSHNRNKLRR